MSLVRVLQNGGSAEGALPGMPAQAVERSRSGKSTFNDPQNRDVSLPLAVRKVLTQRCLPLMDIAMSGIRHQFIPTRRILRSDFLRRHSGDTFTLQQVCGNFRESTQGGLHGTLIWEHADT
ncbi:hypothetical protein SAMN03159444_00680 [Pseudomonas sp. NFACC02]|nr:hypothetical protein SAMN03159444_00680 [Pseudomonas sp. NFACC02]